MQNDPNPSGLCMCGCGRPTKLAPRTTSRLGHVKGRPLPFLHGHSKYKRAPTVFAGDRFGRLTVLREVEGRRGGRAFVCACECGAEVEVLSQRLRIGDTRSCGCLARDSTRTHGMTGTPTYTSWVAMVGRCTREKASNYKRYGGRGILPCAAMLTFSGFYSALGVRPEGHTIDRIDVNGGYWCGVCDDCTTHGRKRNVRWADAITQANNKRKAA